MDNYGGSADQLVIMQNWFGSDTKRGVSYIHWESGDWALKPDKCGR